jgi:methyltransferase (TIGR00027 family)
MLGLRSHIILRSRYAEDRLAQAYPRGIRQFLLLGAGLDTFAWRRPAEMKDLPVFEADHPATQSQKRQRLLQAGVEFPANYEMVPVDFESGALADALRKSTFDFTTPSFVSCLGVMIYLSTEAVDGIFRFVAGLPAGTEFVFTFGRKDATPGSRETAQRVATVGEPWRTFHEPEELERKLRQMGYSSLHFLSPAEAAALYYTGRPHGLPAPSQCNIATAIV